MKKFALMVAGPVLLMTGFANLPESAPRFDAWKILGPGGGGTMLAPTISPHDSNVVFEHCDMTGAYVTLNAGQSWRMFNLRAVVETFAFDPGGRNVVYAGNAALWRSEDNGASWRMLFPNPARRTIEHQTGDHSDYHLTSADAGYPAGASVTAIAVDPSNSERVYAAFASRQTRGSLLFASADRGAAFRRVRMFPGEQILSLHFGADGLLAIGRKAVYRKTTNAWEATPVPGDAIEQASAAQSQGRTLIYVTTRAGEVFVSEDSGRKWANRTPALGKSSGKFEAVAASGAHGEVAYAGFRGVKEGGMAAAIYNGIAKTSDAGLHWTVVFREATRPAQNLDASWVEDRAPSGGDDIFFDAPASLGVAPGNPDICYATDLFRTYRTLDGGNRWTAVNSVRAGGDRWTTRGLDVTTNYGVHFDPFDSRHLFIDYTDIGAFHSYDGGASWETATNGVPQRWRNTTYWLVSDPEVKGFMWGAFSGVHDLPRPKMWRGRDPLAYVGGVGVSTDGGRNWKPSNGGMPETAVTHVLLDPSSHAGQRTLYACGFGRGVYKSADNGKTWVLKIDGITETKPFAWRLTRANDGTLYLVLARDNEGRAGEPGSGALYVSSDGAEHWKKMRLPSGCNGPNGLTLDPRDNRRMYLAAWGQEGRDVDSGGGIFLSTDAGETWRQILRESQHVYDVTVDPRRPEILYASGFDAAAYRSIDAGAHWARIRGYNFKWGHRVIPDPDDLSKIYITTYGGSVWHGPAAGDPDATEDILTPVPVAQ
ncbi:MAG: hypothetical protein U0Q18_10475 [Bryobacteraceae bacterium]